MNRLIVLLSGVLAVAVANCSVSASFFNIREHDRAISPGRPSHPELPYIYMQQETMLRAIVRLEPHDASTANVTGELRIMQDGPYNPPSHITGRVYGLSEGLHGLHVHEKGDIQDGCMSAGAHYNPTNAHHGGKNDGERHVGDLGNILANNRGEAHVDITDSIISLTGPYGILGRSVVVHSDVDDLGKGNNKLSLATGNSGGRLACGIVAVL